MTSPPDNKRKWVAGFEGIHVRFLTDPIEIMFAMREATWGSPIEAPTQEQIRETIDEIASGKSLGGAKEVPALAWVVQCSRSTMDQTLRLREAAAGAQTTRDNDMRDFNVIVPTSIEQFNVHDRAEYPIEDDYFTDGIIDSLETLFSNTPGNMADYEAWELSKFSIEVQRRLYAWMIESGKVPPQDARYLFLPLGTQTHYVHAMTFRAFEKMCEQRLCNGLTQHETNYVTRLMRDAIVTHFPYLDKMFRSACEKKGKCVERSMLFPGCGAFRKCTKDTNGDGNCGGMCEACTEQVVPYEFDPEKQLYPAELNKDGQMMAQWDKDRAKLEADPIHNGTVFSMSGPPEPIARY